MGLSYHILSWCIARMPEIVLLLLEEYGIAIFLLYLDAKPIHSLGQYVRARNPTFNRPNLWFRAYVVKKRRRIGQTSGRERSSCAYSWHIIRKGHFIRYCLLSK